MSPAGLRVEGSGRNQAHGDRLQGSPRVRLAASAPGQPCCSPQDPKLPEGSLFCWESSCKGSPPPLPGRVQVNQAGVSLRRVAGDPRAWRRAVLGLKNIH